MTREIASVLHGDEKKVINAFEPVRGRMFGVDETRLARFSS